MFQGLIINHVDINFYFAFISQKKTILTLRDLVLNMVINFPGL